LFLVSSPSCIAGAVKVILEEEGRNSLMPSSTARCEGGVRTEVVEHANADCLFGDEEMMRHITLWSELYGWIGFLWVFLTEFLTIFILL